MIDLAEMSPGRDSSDFERFEKQGHVPWSLFKREREWREELQATLDGIFAAPIGNTSVPWPTSERVVSDGRAVLQRMVDEELRVKASLTEAKREHNRELARMRTEREQLQQRVDAAVPPPPPPQSMALDSYLRLCERMLLSAAIENCRGSRQDAAAALGIGRSTLFRKLQEHGLY